MFDIGWQELFIVSILALIVVGPKDLPRAIRNITGLMRKARLMARDFQVGIDEVVREADLDEMKNSIKKLSDEDITNQIKNAVDPSGELIGNPSLIEIEEEFNDNFNNRLNLEDTQSPDTTPVEDSEIVKVSQTNSAKDD